MTTFAFGGVVFAPVIKRRRKRRIYPDRLGQPGAVLAPSLQQASSGGSWPIYAEAY